MLFRITKAHVNACQLRRVYRDKICGLYVNALNYPCSEELGYGVAQVILCTTHGINGKALLRLK